MTTQIDQSSSNTVLFHTLLFLRAEVDALKDKVERCETDNERLQERLHQRYEIIRGLQDELDTAQSVHEIQTWQLQVAMEQRNRAIAIANRRLAEVDRLAAVATTRYWNGLALWDAVDSLHQLLRDATRDVDMSGWEDSIQDIINEATEAKDVIMGEAERLNGEETEEEEDVDMEAMNV